MSQVEEEIIISGSLLSLTVFQEKLMRNFYIINSRLKKLQGLTNIQAKTRNLQKELKFLTTKVDTIMEKVPKDGASVTKKDVQTIINDQFFQIFNSSEDKIKQTETFKSISAEIQKLKVEVTKSNTKTHHHQGSNHKQSQKTTSFTAGSILLSEAKKPAEPSKKLLNEVLTKEQSKIVGQIMDQDKQEPDEFQKIKIDIKKLFSIIDDLKVGIGYQHFVDKQVNQYEKHQISSKSQQGGRKKKSPNKNNQGEDDKSKNTQNPKRQGNNQHDKLKAQYSLEMQRNPNTNRLSQNYGNGNSETIVKQDFLARKNFNPSMKTPTTLLNKEQLSVNFINKPSQSNQFPKTNPHFNKLGQMTKIEYIPENKLLSKAQRSKSLKKLERVQKKLRVDDIKDLNSVLKEIQLRLENKANQDIFTQFIKEFEEKLQILRITKDPTNQISDLRRMIYNLDSKMQYVVTYLQSITNQDEALIVKKSWTCISCDKMVQKFNGKTGQHINWDSVQSKKISPTKIGAFGQTGQLANKIKNLLNNQGAE